MTLDQAEERRKSLLARIPDVFRDVPRPVADQIATSSRIPDLEVEGIIEAFAPYRWEDVPDKVIFEQGYALTFMTAVGFRYYLPSYMTYCLKNRNDEKGFGQQIIYHLSWPNKKQYPDRYLNRIAVFTPQEREVISEFARFLWEYDEDADKNLDYLNLFNLPQS